MYFFLSARKKYKKEFAAAQFSMKGCAEANVRFPKIKMPQLLGY